MTSTATGRSVRSADGTSIAFETIGTGPALVLVDAACGFRGFGPMGSLAAQLAPAFTVYTYDRRGRGESGDTASYAVDREVDDLAALVEAAGGYASMYGFSSGAVLALHAAARGVPIGKLALLEPPLAVGDRPADPDFGPRLAELVAAGRRGDAVEHFNRAIGVPEEMVAGMRDQPFWPTLEAVAHTLPYDCEITASFAVGELSGIATPTLVIDSAASDGGLRTSAEVVADALPNGSHRRLKGEWHGVAPEVLAPALRDFFL